MDPALTAIDDSETTLVAALRLRSDKAFVRLVQETWIGVLEGIDRFESRSSFRTWLFRILINKAQRRGVQERRTAPFSAFPGNAADPFPPAARPRRLRRPAAH